MLIDSNGLSNRRPTFETAMSTGPKAALASATRRPTSFGSETSAIMPTARNGCANVLSRSGNDRDASVEVCLVHGRHQRAPLLGSDILRYAETGSDDEPSQKATSSHPKRLVRSAPRSRHPRCSPGLSA